MSTDFGGAHGPRRHVAPRGGIALAVLALLVSLLMGPRSLSGQSENGFRLPLELFQGGALIGAGRVKPYQVGMSIAPTYAFRRLRIGLKATEDFDNPGWHTRLGPRLSVRIAPIFRQDLEVFVGGEFTTTTDGHERWGGFVILEQNGLRGGLAGGWEDIHQSAWFGITVGLDPTRWFGCVRDDFTGECLPG